MFLLSDVNFKKTLIYTNSIIYVSWTLIITYINLIFISNSMIFDHENGIINLEVSKGFKQSELLLYKTLAKFFYSIVFNISLIIVMVCLLYIINPVNLNYIAKNLIPGFLSFIAFDFLITGLYFTFCSFKKIRIVLSLTSFVSILYIFSPLVGRIQFIIGEGKVNVNWNSFSYDVEFLKNLEDLSYKKDGLIYSLLYNLGSLKNDYSLKKDFKGTTDNCEDKNYICYYEQFDEENKNRDVSWGYSYVAANGLMLDVEYFLNNSKTFSQNFKYTLNEKINENKIYKFFNITIMKNNEGKFEDTYFYKPSKNNLSGKNQLLDYFSYIQQDEMILNIKKIFNLSMSNQELKEEINSVNNILLKYFESIFYNNFDSHNYKVYSLIREIIQNYDYDIENKTSLVNEKDFYENAKLKNGNRLYMALLFNLFDEYLSTWEGDLKDFEKIYNYIQTNDFYYNKFFTLNPIYYHLNLLGFSTYSSYTDDILTQNKVYDLNMPIRSFLVEKNPNYMQSDYKSKFSMYDSLENSYIKKINLSKRVVSSEFIYIGYILFGILSGLIGILIYRKVNVF
ncbi:hypothetical protein [Spiroplasma tabanidicola]|uniref:Uncharacterized protein n=1 Tax=Spiroplasma tabanidicola TaxID=324079 RepID=A0A6I6CCS1_9MOLU|nr:hypothetical protein [Spiroplasma tabanidicola]QGS51764.1 hypothetical protein STABA_v1c04010 [Spiroplasma tabanidicola]